MMHKIFRLAVLAAALAAVAAGPAVAQSSVAPAPRAMPGQHPNFVHFRVGQSNVKALLVTDDTTWIGTSGGLIRYLNGSGEHRFYNNRSGLLSNGVFYVGQFDREIWVGTYGGGLSILRPADQSWRHYNIPEGLADAFVYDVLKTRSGDVWIATWSGANRIIGGDLDRVEDWRLYTVANTAGGLPNDWVYGLAEGKDGEIWLATEGGLARYAEGRWANWNHKAGLGAPYELVEADIEFRNDPGQFSAHHARQKQEQGLEGVEVAYNPNYVVSLAVDAEGTVWAGTWGAGLSRFDGRGWRTFTLRDGLPGNHVFALEADPQGGLWIGTNRGLARYDGENFVIYSHRDGLFADTVFALGVGADNSAWVGSFGGVAWFPKGIGRPAAAQ